MRRGASILAAVAVVAGGLMAGAGTAVAACEVATHPECGPTNWSRSGTVENITVGSIGPHKLSRDTVASFRSSFSVSSAPDRSVTKVVYHVPTDLVFQAVTVEQLTFSGAETTRETLPTGAVTVDSAAGTVTIDAPTGGWQLPQSEAGNVSVTVDYKAPQFASLAWLPIGMTFEASGIDGPQGWANWANTSIVETPQEEAGGYLGSVESAFDYGSSSDS